MKLYKFLFNVLNRNKINVDNDTRFVALTPTDKASEVEQYINALAHALREDCIKNIALTGPYGSGKTSIIKTFEKQNSFKFLYISLASFREDSGEKNSVNNAQNIMIERSILQQMLYGADANKLPYSRFKRISTPDHPFIKSVLFVSWAVTSAFLCVNRDKFLTVEFFNQSFWWSILLILFIIGIPSLLISNIYKSSFGMSFKKISFKNAEVETADVPETSILNRHLDEIIYFFQMTKYDVVVIEDLDRFDSPEIFVKLREINKLINDNTETSGKIKFLYALKDDMFANKSRTKFFDFIIPIVPIINSTNSLDKMIDRLKSVPFAEKIDRQFLREVSLYIDDLRLMNNIFNEFNIYNAKLGSDSLNMTKLLAMMFFKNMYPGDFENLHHGEGAFYKVCRMRSELIAQTRQRLSKDIADIQKQISDAESEEAKNVEELIKIFIGYVATSTEFTAVHGIYINDNLVPFTELKTWASFEGLFQTQQVQVAVYRPGYGQYHRASLGQSFSQLEAKASPNQPFVQRKTNIENKTSSVRLELQSKIRKLEKEKLTASQKPLHKLLQINDVSVQEVLVSNNIIDDNRLLVYLIKNGYIDENYYLYTSNFHEGRLTKNDRDFLLSIRDFKSPDPKQQLDNLGEVITNMRPEDFEQKYVLNIALVDFLLANKMKYKREIDSAIDYISSNFQETEEFYTAYWDIGVNGSELVKTIAAGWPGYGTVAVKSPQAADHLARILSEVDPKYIAEKMNSQNIITDYLSEHGNLVFVSDIPAPHDFSVLIKLNVKFRQLSGMLGNKALIDFAHRENLYAINPENIGLLLDLFPRRNTNNQLDHTASNFTAICSAGSDELRQYVHDNLPKYVDNVFLALPDNVKENPEIVKQLLNEVAIDIEKKQQIILKQEIIFDKFEGIPVDLWEFTLTHKKVRFFWPNISSYLKENDCKKEIVTELFNDPHIVDVISLQRISTEELGEADSESLADFVIKNDQIKDVEYEKLIKCVPYTYEDFPSGISQKKRFYLAKIGTVILTDKSFQTAEEDEQLLSILIGSNITEYLTNKEKYPITDSVREKLLSFEISNAQKIAICGDVTPAGFKESEKLARIVSDYIKLPEADCALFNSEVILSTIMTAQNIEDSIRILMKCIPLWDKKQIMDVLGQLPSPFNEISEHGKSPKLPKTPTNLQLARLLETHKFILSFIEKEDAIRINTFKASSD